MSQKHLTRREMMLASASLPLLRAISYAAIPARTRKPMLDAARHRPGTLAFAAAKTDMLFGTLFDSTFSDDPAYIDLLRQELSLAYVAGFDTHTTRRSPENFDYQKADDIIASITNDHALAGGYLVVHGDEPSWITASTSRRDALLELKAVVSTPLKRYAGRLDHWIVVNEAIEPDDGRLDGFRNCLWHASIGGSLEDGTDYVSQAFAAARLADPKATLVYNDYGLEYTYPQSIQKREAVLRLLDSLRRAGTIDGLGLQAHLIARSIKFEAAAFDRFIDDVAGLGLKVYITELDVDDRALPSDIVARDEAVARTVEQFLDVALHHTALTAINTWGLSDSHSWHNQANFPRFHRIDGLLQRSNLFDQGLKKKTAYYSVVSALATRS